MAKEVKEEFNDGIETVSNPYNEEMVVIQLFKDGDKYKDDVFVARNGYGYRIQRGKKVRVPKGIAEILDNSQKMDELTAEKIAAAQEKAKGN